MKKIVTLVLLVAAPYINAEVCFPQGFSGNPDWINPASRSIDTTVLTDHFRGTNCEDAIYATSSSEAPGDDFAYFLPDLNINATGYSYSFAIDFAEVLSYINTGNRIAFFELWAEDDPVGDGIVQESRIMLIRVKKKPLSNGDYKWKVHIMWYSLPDSNGQVNQYSSHHAWLPSDIEFGMLNFNISSQTNLNYGMLNMVVMSSNLFRYNDDNELELVKLDAGPNANVPSDPVDIKDTHMYISPFKMEAVNISEARLGIISHDDGVSTGDGITFYTPFRGTPE